MPNILLCFTNNLSLKDWQKSGSLSRELIYMKKFVNNNFNYSLLTYGDLNDKNIPLPNSIKVIPLYSSLKRIHNKFFNYLLHFLRILKFAGKLKQFDVIRSNQLIGSNISIIIGIFFRKKVIVRIGYEPNIFLNDLALSINSKPKFINKNLFIKLRLLSFFSYKLSDHIICTSKEQKHFIANNFKIKKNKISIIPNWIDTSIFKPAESNLEKKGILCIGRFEEEKNFEILFNSMFDINEKITIIGSGSLKEKYINIAKSNYLNLEILNPIPNIELVDFYQKCKIFVQPSHREGNPKTILEAMSCGCAVIAKNVIGVREVLNDKNGLLINKDSELNQAMKNLLDDKEKREKIGENARKDIKDNYDINKCFEKEKKLIFDLIR